MQNGYSGIKLSLEAKAIKEDKSLKEFFSSDNIHTLSFSPLFMFPINKSTPIFKTE